jgi:hypothetical protein
MVRSEWEELFADQRYCLVAKDVFADGRIEVTTVRTGRELAPFRIVVLKKGEHTYSDSTNERRDAVSAHARIVVRFIPA